MKQMSNLSRQKSTVKKLIETDLKLKKSPEINGIPKIFEELQQESVMVFRYTYNAVLEGVTPECFKNNPGFPNFFPQTI